MSAHSRIILLVALVSLWASVASSQVRDGDATRVNCVSGCSGGTSDTDDGSIAAGQTTGLNIGLTHAYDGAVWRRLTFGTAGTASTQVFTMQGIASMTPIQIINGVGTSISGNITSWGSTAVNGGVGAVTAGSPRVASIIHDGTDTALVSVGGALSVDPGTVTVTATNLDVQIGGSDTITVTDGAGAMNVVVDSITAGDTDIGNVDLEIAGTGVSTGVGASGAQTIRTASLIHDGTDTALVSAGGALSVDPGTVTVTATNLDVQIGGSDTLTVTDGAGAMNTIIDSGTVTTVSTVTSLSQFAGNAINLGSGTIGTGTLRINIATDDPVNDAAVETSVAIGAIAAAVPTSAMLVGGTDGTNLVAPYIDPCQREARTTYVVDIVTATTTEIANAVASEFFYVCSINLFSAGTNNVAIVEDDTDACASPTAGLNGGITAAEGYNFTAQTGIVTGIGSHYVMKTATANRYFCIITSAAVQLSGTITYVSAP